MRPRAALHRRGYDSGMPADALPSALRAAFEATATVGPPPGADHRGEARNPACGDIVVIWLAISDGVVRAAGFQAQGCPAVMASAAGACAVAEGLPADLSLGGGIERRFVERFGAPRAAHRHALALVAEAFASAASAA